MTEQDALRAFIKITEGPMEEYQFFLALQNEVRALSIPNERSLPRRAKPITKDSLVFIAFKNMKRWYLEGNESKVPLRWKNLAGWIPHGRVAQLWCIALRKYHISECL